MEASWLISLVVIIVAVCAGLAALGFRGRITTVGIDLGTTFSVVGINKQGKIIIIEDKAGHKIFPSIVSYRNNGEIVVGYDALGDLSSRPQNTIYNAKRFIGRSLDEDQVRTYADEHPFKVVPSSLSNFSKVGFEIETDGVRRVVSPEQVGTEVLRFLLKVTADFLGHSQVNKAVVAVPAKFNSEQRQATGEAYKRAGLKVTADFLGHSQVNKAVVAVPAKFNSEQRQATGEAYKRAGLKVMRVIEEPTAAAVAYKLHKKSNIHHILVYDFGGGTLDVSLLYVAKGSVQVYATDGDETLGGSDFDLCLAKTIKNRVEQMTQVAITNDHTNVLHAASASDVSEDELCSFPSIHTKAEEIKKQLTYSEEVGFNCTLLDKEGGATVVQFSVQRERDFHEGCQHLFERGLLPVHRLLHDLNMRKDDVDEVVLVGGSTRIPLVKQRLRDFFNKELNDHIDPDVTVAYGAASILD